VRVTKQLEKSFDSLEAQSNAAAAVQLMADGLVGRVQGTDIHKRLLQVLVEARL
jgi:hypothetical protein